MIVLGELLLSLLDAVPFEAGDPSDGIRVEVDTVELVIPIESRLMPDGSFRATMPRGQVATGFDLPHGELAVSFGFREETA